MTSLNLQAWEAVVLPLGSSQSPSDGEREKKAITWQGANAPFPTRLEPEIPGS